MTRRKVPRHAAPAPSTTSQSPSVAKDYVSARDYYNRRYQELDKKRRSTGPYEATTESHINRMEGLWKEYGGCPSLHARSILSFTNDLF